MKLRTCLVALWLIASLVACGRPPSTLVVVHFNDFHAQYDPVRDRHSRALLGGGARFVQRVETLRAQEPSLVLIGGDNFTGTPLSTFYRGEAELAWLGALRPDAMVLGNHDFDYGSDRMLELYGAASFAVLCANCLVEGEPITGAAYAVFERGGYRIAVVGLITPDTAFVTMPENVRGVEFADPIATARALVPELREQADAVIFVNHMGLELDAELARSVPGIDLIVSGHDHKHTPEPRTVNGVPIVEAGSKGRWLGRAEIRLSEAGASLMGYELVEITQDIPEHPAAVEALAPFRAELDARMERVVGQLTHTLVGDGARREETNLGDLVTDVIRERLNTDVAFINGGGIRANIDAGAVTAGQIMTAFPFPNTLVRFELTGAQLLEVLEYSMSIRGGGGFLQVSGLSITASDEGALDVLVNGQPLDPGAAYSVATVNFLVQGGDGYDMLATWLDETRVQDSGIMLGIAVIDAIELRGLIDLPGPEGRVAVPDRDR